MTQNKSTTTQTNQELKQFVQRNKSRVNTRTESTNLMKPLTHLVPTAKPNVGESAKARESTMIETSPETIIGFLPMESVTCPKAYPVTKRPKVKALATYPA